MNRNKSIIGAQPCVVNLALALALAFALTSTAGPLLPGSTVPVPTVPDSLGVTYETSLLTLIEQTPSLQSVLTALVWDAPASNPYGGLTFSYTLDASIFQADELHRLTIAGFDGFETYIEQSEPVPGEAWTFATRDSNQDIVGGFVSLGAGELSRRLVVHTDATDWTRVQGAAINGRSVNLTTLGPFNPEDPVVPEPRHWAMLAGLGLLGLAVFRRFSAAR